MKKICLLKDEVKREERFFEILFDERLAKGAFLVPKTELYQIGGINRRMKAKQQYELLLRFADAYYVELEECPPGNEAADGFLLLDGESTGPVREEISADCYIIAKYRDKLLARGFFDAAVQSVIEAADAHGMKEEAVRLLERMLKRQEAYYRIDDAIRPILIYKGEDICYNVLNIFAEQFGEALRRMGQKVEYFDPEQDDIASMSKYIGKHYCAVIGMQTYLFSIMMQDGTAYLHDKIYGPKYNFIFDHPIWIRKHLVQCPKDLHILTHDMGYVKFCERYYKRKSFLFPPAGICPQMMEQQRKYQISFVGTYGDYLAEAFLMHQMDRKIRFLSNRFLSKMRKHPNLAADEAFRLVLDETGEAYAEEEYMDLFFRCRRTIYCVMHYYRAKTMETLLKAGFQVDVFGESWEKSDLRKYPNLICHPNVSSEESMQVWKQSKISLNVMSWHKGGFTERMANIMMCGAVLLTDHTDYLAGRLEAGKDLLVFQLDRQKELLAMIKEYLSCPEKLLEMAESGKKKAWEHHTWSSRAEEFLNIVLEDEVCGAE